MNIFKNILERDFLLMGKRISLIATLWFVIALFFSVHSVLRGHTNNFKIFTASFYHLLDGKNLYAAYPAEHHDYFLYGPVFTIIIALFALLPFNIGLFLWNMFNAAVLYFAIKKLPFTLKSQSIILLLCCFEMAGNIQSNQSNALLAACIILSFAFNVKGKAGWGAFFAALGFLFKVYGCVAFAFFFFSGNKKKFLLYSIISTIIILILPAVFSSPEFMVQTYKDWFQALSVKNSVNETSDLQNMSVMRMADVFTGQRISQAILLSIGAIGVLAPLFRYKMWRKVQFGLLYLSLLLITVVIFSSSAEGSTYIIAMSGAAIWYVSQNKLTGWPLYFILFVLVAGSLSTSDLFPRTFINSFIRPFGIKTLPYLILWIVTIAQLFKPNIYFNTNHEKKDFDCSTGI